MYSCPLFKREISWEPSILLNSSYLFNLFNKVLKPLKEQRILNTRTKLIFLYYLLKTKPNAWILTNITPLSEMCIFKIIDFSFLEYYSKLTIVQGTLYIFIFVVLHNNILDYEAPISDWGKCYLKTLLPPQPDSSVNCWYKLLFWSLITKYSFMAKKMVSDSC